MTNVSVRRGKKEVAKAPREVLRDLRNRSGYGAAELARALGYKSTNGYIQYEYAQMGDKPIPAPLVTRLIPLMRGRGTPPVTADELIAISDARSLRIQTAPQDTLPPPTEDGRRHANSALLPVLYRVEKGVFFDAETVEQKRYRDGPIAPASDVDVSAQFVAVVAGAGAHLEALHCVRPDQIGAAGRAGRRCVCIKEREKTGLVEVIVSRIGKDGEPEDGKLVGVVIGAYKRE